MRGVLRSELTKFFSYPWSILGLIGAVLTAPIALFFMSMSNESNLQASDVLALCLRTLYLGQVGVVVAAAGFWGQEYSQSCIRTTFLAVPSRGKVIAAKWIVLSISVMLAGVISVLLNPVVASLGFNSELTLNMAIKYMANAAPAIFSWVQMAFITSCLSILTKSLVAPIAVMISLILGLSQMLFSISVLAKYLPDLAVMNLFLATGTATFLDKWLGIAVQFAWVVLFGTAAAWLTSHRDVR